MTKMRMWGWSGEGGGGGGGIAIGVIGSHLVAEGSIREEVIGYGIELHRLIRGYVEDITTSNLFQSISEGVDFVIAFPLHDDHN